MKFTTQQLVAAGYPPTMERAQPWLEESLRDIRKGYPKASELEVNQMLEASIINRHPPRSLEHAKEILAKEKLHLRVKRLCMAAGMEAVAEVEENPQEKAFLLKRVAELRK
ncbi:MAG: hypothetical protein AAB680_04855 [Pseudomonadota bacterium]